MEGFRNYKKWINGRVEKIEKGTLKGKLYHLKDINCPALISGNDTVHIQIMTLSSNADINQVIKELDMMEGYISSGNKDNTYNRVMHKVYNESTGKEEILEIYEYNMDNPKVSKENMIYIANGNWKDYMKDKKDLE